MEQLTYILRRIGQALPVMLGVSVVAFLLLHLGGDPVRLMAPPDTTAAELEQLRRAYGLDRPLPVQYRDFLGGVIRGDFGRSLRSGQDALGLALERLPATGKLAFAALAIALIGAFPLGTLAAIKQGTWIDQVVMLITLIGQSMPVFWLGVLLMLVFAVNLRVLPATGAGHGWRSLVLPAVTLGMFNMGRTARLFRSELLEVLHADYIRTARGKGLSERGVLFVHAMRNAIIPMITLIGLDLGALLAGSVITETIFAWPGIGRLAINAIYASDYPVVQSTVFLVAATYVTINVLVDISYTLLNPRITVG